MYSDAMSYSAPRPLVATVVSASQAHIVFRCFAQTGLFFYDIYWVFFTPVMVGVAKNIDGPIKLLFPVSLATADAGAHVLFCLCLLCTLVGFIRVGCCDKSEFDRDWRCRECGTQAT